MNTQPFPHPSLVLRGPSRPALRRVALAAAAALAATAAGGAQAALSGVLYSGLGYDIVAGADGSLAPVGFVQPTLAYVLPSASSGGTASGRGMGVGSAQYSSSEAFLGYRGLVTSPAGSYALGTLGTNQVPGGWTPVGSGSSSAVGVADSGIVAGSSELWSADGTQDFGGRPVWFAAGETVPRQLKMPPHFTDPSGMGFGGASGIATNGVIIGWGNLYHGATSEGNRVLRWMTPTSEPEVLQRLPGMSEWGGNNSWGVAVNAAGAVAGSGNVFDAAGNLRGLSAIRWAAGTTDATPLGHLGTAEDGTYASRALAINDTGVTVGQSAKYDAAHQPLGDAAVRWPAKSARPVELAGLGVGRDGQGWTYALGINDSGTVFGVGQAFSPAGDALGWRAMRWLPGETRAHALKPLSMGLSGSTYTYAFSMNRKGWVVGTANAVLTDSSDFSNPAHLDVHAVAWGPDGSIHDLNKLLPAGSPWKLYSAYSISDSGLVTGIGYFQPEGYGVEYSYARLYSMQLTKMAE